MSIQQQASSLALHFTPFVFARAAEAGRFICGNKTCDITQM